MRVISHSPGVVPSFTQGRVQSNRFTGSPAVPIKEDYPRLLSHMSLYLGTWISGIQEHDNVESELDVLSKFSDMFKVHVVAPTDHLCTPSSSDEEPVTQPASDVSTGAKRGRINSIETGTVRPVTNPFRGCMSRSTWNEFGLRDDSHARFEGYSGRQAHLAWFSFKFVRLIVLLSYPGYNWKPMLTRHVGVVRYFTELNEVVATVQL